MDGGRGPGGAGRGPPAAAAADLTVLLRPYRESDPALPADRPRLLPGPRGVTAGHPRAAGL
ncbi:hypothetical protein AB0E75_22995 [Streptomyces griseoviridis]|uniref:Uncharacterized protein n=2 Tax=Streptomyces griseoviridis TaxID=45398 RepID=A0A918GLM3_STRGD|nr:MULTISPECIES: hypothetical protein [Streptomyces]MDP9684719.1 hypothetical protein [Streptomyces griseoviridis]GGS45027.1 hypothetical protein GCM10010238_38480 [Streptomyces niveoruber]GGT07189.1 hypothetical protein GCM10010240_45660 [Streptomyces griseoviridis]